MERAVTGNYSAKAAIDVALHDLKARSLNLPLSDLIGGAIQQGIPIAWTLASGDTQRDIAIAEEMIERRRHNRFKIKIRSEEPTPEIQSLMRTPYAVFCLQKTTSIYQP